MVDQTIRLHFDNQRLHPIVLVGIKHSLHGYNNKNHLIIVRLLEIGIYRIYNPKSLGYGAQVKQG